VNNERPISLYWGWSEQPRGVEWVRNCQDEIPLRSENPASLYHRLLESFNVLKAHERDHTIGNGVWEWERNSISHNNFAHSLGMSGRRSSEHT
jgi:hypothetical protein